MAKVSGHKRHSARLKRLPEDTRREIGKAIFVGAGLIEADARVSIIKGGIQGKGHIPSRPGEPPNRDTGVLDQNIVAKKTGDLTAEVASQAPYSAALEFGTSTIDERPFMRPATQKNRAKIEKLAGRAVSVAVRKSKGGGGA